MENIKKAFGSDSDDNIYKKIFNFFTIYFQDNPIADADSAQCNNESITIQECETDTEQEPASPQQTQQTPLQQTPPQQTQETPQPPQPPQQQQQQQQQQQPPTPTAEQSAEDKKLEKKILSYIFEYDNEKEIKKRIKLLNAKYSLKLNKNDLDMFALHSNSLKDIHDASNQQIEIKPPQQSTTNITTRDVNTFVDFLAKYKFSYNHSDIDNDIKKLIKLYNKVGVNINKITAEKMLIAYFPNGKLDKSKLEYLYKKGENDNVKPSNESENLRAFNIFLKSLDNKDINNVIEDVYDGITPSDPKTIDVFKQLFSDSKGKFKISSISKLF